jgi:hypothetical protein
MPTTQTSNLQAEIMQIPNVGDSNVACFQVGASPSIAFALSLGSVAPAYAITRQPSGGTAAISSTTGAFSSPMNVPGLYVCTATQGGVTRTVYLVAVPVALLSQAAGNSGKTVTLEHVHQLLVQTQGQWSATTFAASVEAASPGPSYGFNPVLFGAASAQLGVNWAAYL